MTAINTGREQQTHFIDQTGLEESAVDVTAALKQQGLNAEMFSEQMDCLREIH